MKKKFILILILFVLLIISSCDPKPKHAHTWGEWTLSKAATCTEDGIAIRRCISCGNQDEETQVLKALGHLLSKSGTITIEATCGTEGEETYLCTRENCSYKEIKILSATGAHKYGEEQTIDATCTEDGKKYRVCSVCNKEDDISIISAKGHTFGEYGDVLETCTEPGRRYSICSVCNQEYDITEVPPLGHCWGEWKIDIAGSCTTKELRTRLCTNHDCTAIDSDYSYGNHPKEKLVWKSGDTISFLTETEKKEYCTECNSFTGNTKNDYDSIEGYWLSNDSTKTDNGVAYECYFSIDMDNTGNALIENVVTESDGKIKDISRTEYTYTWVFDKTDSKVRTGLKLTSTSTSDDNSATLQYSITENNSDGTLTLTSENSSFTLTRKSTEHHTEHTYANAEKKDEYYHIIKTNCNEEFHEVIYKEESHEFNDDKTCEICGYSKPYILNVTVYYVDSNGRQQYDHGYSLDCLKIERGEELYPEKSYIFKDNGKNWTITEIIKWVTIKNGNRVTYETSNSNPIELEYDMSLEIIRTSYIGQR